MPPSPRIEFEGAIYHVMARGSGSKRSETQNHRVTRAYNLSNPNIQPGSDGAMNLKLNKEKDRSPLLDLVD